MNHKSNPPKSYSIEHHFNFKYRSLTQHDIKLTKANQHFLAGPTIPSELKLRKRGQLRPTLSNDQRLLLAEILHR